MKIFSEKSVPILGQKGTFLENLLQYFFSFSIFLPLCKIPKKTNKRILRKTGYRGTRKRTGKDEFINTLFPGFHKTLVNGAIGQYSTLCQEICYNAAITTKSHKVLKSKLM